MSFTISTLTLEAFLLVLVRVACFTSIAPIFGHNSLNARMKISIAFFVSLILYQVVDVSLPEYTNVLGYTTLVLEEALVGLLLGFVAGTFNESTGNRRRIYRPGNRIFDGNDL